ncbi:MAG: hypothetical protein ACRD4L_08270, partial [Pyrinomonadaceae bacterium]
GQVWADPDIDHAAKLMRHVYLNQDEASRKAQKAALDILNTYSARAVSTRIHDRLEVISSLSPHRPHQTPMYKKPKLPEFSPNGYFGLMAKRVMKRLIRFHTTRQEDINRHLLQLNYDSEECTEDFRQDMIRDISELKHIMHCLISEMRKTDSVDIGLLNEVEKKLKSLRTEINLVPTKRQ